MTLKEFIDKYNGKYVEAGGSTNAQFQCVDLINQYIVNVLNDKKLLWTNADDFWTRADKRYKRISKSASPQAGDIPIWNIGNYGHIAIATGKIKGSVIEIFSQNYPLKSPAKVINFSTKNLIGYLRPPKTNNKDMIPEHFKKQLFSDDVWGEVIKKLEADKFMKRRPEIVQDMKTGEVWAVNGSKELKYNLKREGSPLVFSYFVWRAMEISERDYKETKKRTDIYN